MDTRTGT